MKDHIVRQSFFRTSRYQRPLMSLTLMPTFVFCCVLSIFVLFLHNELLDYMKTSSSAEGVRLMQQGGWFAIVMIWSFFMVTFIWAKKVSHRMVGAFERVNRELDQVVSGSDIDKISARDHDELVGDILLRINTLISQNRALAAKNISGRSMGSV